MSKKPLQVRLDPENATGVLERVKTYRKAGLKLSLNSVANEVVKAGLEVVSKPDGEKGGR